MWIRCDERLPELGQLVLTIDANGEFDIACLGKPRNSAHRWIGAYGESECNPTHWMPLPEPPEENNDD